MANACGPTSDGRRPSRSPWVTGHVESAVGQVPQVDTTLRFADRLGAWKARWAIGRMRYSVPPGLYAVGRPGRESPVLVTANYKMTFDRVRSQLAAVDAWLLVLDTHGINVWCAAGKGTFGTDELVRRVAATRLQQLVAHRRLILPQLAAPGVAAHEVLRRCGFRVIYGPVRAEDIPRFLEADMQATPDMRRVRFPLRDRLAVAPVELVMAMKYILLMAICFFLLSGLGADGYSWQRAIAIGLPCAAVAAAVSFGSILLTPVLLPWLPGRMFAVKGFWLGVAMLGIVGVWSNVRQMPVRSWVAVASWCVLIPTLASFMAMNYTGSTPYTSLSGVRVEVRRAVPVQVIGAVIGVALWLTGRFV
ncbi:MAG: acetyl-CoA synthase subunit gamma [Planctomycetes bacterium]|nr:acetyl-CoA synthase subunit gamma [Planctomycetota bacterium]